MSLPVIGLTASRTVNRAGVETVSINNVYIQAVLHAGGLPFLIPTGLSENQACEALSHVQGLLLTGGGDIDPALYHGNFHPRVSDVSHERDALEIALVKQAAREDLPFLGICRGIQVINVALGGTLYTDIGDQLPAALKHDSPPGSSRTAIAHVVEIVDGTLLKSLVSDDPFPVNSFHHQGILSIAPGLTATAYASDGLIEAVEIPGNRFGLGVQWHPEWFVDIPAMRAIFLGLVKAAENA